MFWNSHDSTNKVYSRQYRNAIFYLSEEQRLQAEKSREQISKEKNRQVYTAIEKAGNFYPAENYHQKYYLRNTGKLIAEFKRMYPDDSRFIASTAAARINGYLGCHGTADDLLKEIGSFGLSPEAQKYLLDYVSTSCHQVESATCGAPKKESLPN